MITGFDLCMVTCSVRDAPQLQADITHTQRPIDDCEYLADCMVLLHCLEQVLGPTRNEEATNE